MSVKVRNEKQVLWGYFESAMNQVHFPYCKIPQTSIIETSKPQQLNMQKPLSESHKRRRRLLKEHIGSIFNTRDQTCRCRDEKAISSQQIEIHKLFSMRMLAVRRGRGGGTPTPCKAGAICCKGFGGKLVT